MSGSDPASRDSSVAVRFGDITYKVIGAYMRVHNALGPGLKEIHYHRALSLALEEDGVAFEDEKSFEVTIENAQLGLLFIDHFVEGAIIVEEKALPHLLTNEEVAQVLTYMAAAEAPLGLLINFGRQRLEYKRILPPRDRQDWKLRAARCVWRPSPSGAEDHPLIRSTSAYDSEVPV